MQLGELDLVAHGPRPLGGERRGGRAREVPRAEGVRFDAMVDAANPSRPITKFPCDVAGGQDDGGRAVGNRWAGVLAQRRDDRDVVEVVGAVRAHLTTVRPRPDRPGRNPTMYGYIPR